MHLLLVRGGDFWAEIGWDLTEEHRRSLTDETRAAPERVVAVIETALEELA